MSITNIRRAERTPVSLDVEVETVLDSRPGRLADLSEDGAKIYGKPLDVGQKVKLTAADSVVWGRVRWAEADRMGVQFETEMPAQLRAMMNARQTTAAGSAPAFGRKGV